MFLSKRLSFVNQSHHVLISHGELHSLVLLFNQSDKSANVTITLKDNPVGWKKATQWEGKQFRRAANVKITVADEDVAALVYE